MPNEHKYYIATNKNNIIIAVCCDSHGVPFDFLQPSKMNFYSRLIVFLQYSENRFEFCSIQLITSTETIKENIIGKRVSDVDLTILRLKKCQILGSELKTASGIIINPPEEQRDIRFTNNGWHVREVEKSKDGIHPEFDNALQQLVPLL